MNKNEIEYRGIIGHLEYDQIDHWYYVETKLDNSRTIVGSGATSWSAVKSFRRSVDSFIGNSEVSDVL